MSKVVSTEFSQEASAEFAELLKMGGFQLVQAIQKDAHSYNEVIYTAPTCLIRFTRSTGKLAEEWDMDMALQPDQEKRPRWIPVWLITIFLKKESPQEAFDRSIKRKEEDRKKKWGPQISMNEYADIIRPFYAQLIKFFEPRGFKKRYKEHEAYLKWRSHELGRLHAAYYCYKYTPMDYRIATFPGTTDSIELTRNGDLGRYGAIVWNADLPNSGHDLYIRFTCTSKRIVAHTWKGYKVSLDSVTGKILSATRLK